MNGKNIETEQQSKSIRELASNIMSDKSPLSLTELRMALDKNGCDLEEAVEMKPAENDVINQVM